MSGLRQVVWKDARLARAYLIVAGALLAAPYVFLAYVRLGDRSLDWPMMLHYAGMVAGLGAIVVASLLSGASMATERADRSIEFLAYLPLSRPTQLASKLAVVLTPVLVLWLANPLIVLDAAPHGWPAIDSPNGGALATLMLSTCLALGVAWVGSALASSAAALLLGLLSPFFVTCAYFAGAVLVERAFRAHVDLDAWFAPVYRWSALGGGCLGLLLGSWIYVARAPNVD